MTSENAVLLGIVVLLLLAVVVYFLRRPKTVAQKAARKVDNVKDSANDLMMRASSSFGQIKRDLSLISEAAQSDVQEVRECLSKRKLLTPTMLNALIEVAKKKKDNVLQKSLEEVRRLHGS